MKSSNENNMGPAPQKSRGGEVLMLLLVCLGTSAFAAYFAEQWYHTMKPQSDNAAAVEALQEEHQVKVCVLQLKGQAS